MILCHTLDQWNSNRDINDGDMTDREWGWKASAILYDVFAIKGNSTTKLPLHKYLEVAKDAVANGG